MVPCKYTKGSMIQFCMVWILKMFLSKCIIYNATSWYATNYFLSHAGWYEHGSHQMPTGGHLAMIMELKRKGPEASQAL